MLGPQYTIKPASFFLPFWALWTVIYNFFDKSVKSRESFQRSNFPLLGPYTHGNHDLMKKHVLQTKKLLSITCIIYGLNHIRYWNTNLKVAELRICREETRAHCNYPIFSKSFLRHSHNTAVKNHPKANMLAIGTQEFLCVLI